MLAPRFCNYNLDYQQRLGFLKLLVRVCEGIRGGPEAFNQRLQTLYTGSARYRRLSSARFDPIPLLEREDIPSWQPGFSKERLDRLVLWAQMVGLIAPNGGLSEWARILQQVSAMDCSPDRDENPFLLSPAERTFFLHLFFYHDQVLPMLVRALAQLPAYTRIGVRDACLMMVECLGEFFNEIQGSGVERVQVSGQLRNLLGRIAAQYMLSDLKTFLVPENRSAALVEIKCRQKVRRVHLAEYHAICRFEQLTDMGLLTKDGRDDGVETGDARRAWEWYVTPPLGRLVNTIPDTLNLETFFEQHWIHFSAQMIGLKLKRTDPFESQIEVARVLDETLPLVRRQLGPVQVHSWAVLTCLRAMKAGMHLEIGDVYQLLDAIRSDPKASNVVRQGGRAQLLGRTAAVVQGKISHFLEASPVRKESTK